MKKNTLFQLPKKFALHFTALFFILYEYTVYKYIYLFLRVFICPEHYHCCQWLSVLFISGFFCFLFLCHVFFNENTWSEWLSSCPSSLLQCLMIVFFLWWIIRSLFFQYAPQEKKKKKKVNICIIHGSPTRVLLNMYIWKLVSWLNKRWSSVVYLNLRASLETSFRLALEAPRAQSVDRCARL